MLDLYVNQGTADALRRFGFHKEAMSMADLEHMHLDPTHAAGGAMGSGGRMNAPFQAPQRVGGPGAAAAPAAAAGGGFMGKVRDFGAGQWDAAKNLAHNLHQGLGGAPDAAAGTAARGAALGNLRTLAPSLLAGGALYMMHRRHRAQEEEEARRRAMMGGGFPGM